MTTVSATSRPSHKGLNLRVGLGIRPQRILYRRKLRNPMYTARFLFTLISLFAALLVAAGAAVFHWATFGTPDPLESPGIALGLMLVLMGGAAIVAAGQRLPGANRRVAG